MFAGSNQVEYNGILRAIEIRSTTSFGGEAKVSWHVQELYECEKIFFVEKIQRPFLGKDYPVSLLDFSAGNCQRGVVDVSGMIRNQVEKNN
jgi:hypothetical protein